MLRHGSWNPGSGEELKIGRHTVRLKRSLGEGGFAFIHLVEVCTGTIDLVFDLFMRSKKQQKQQQSVSSLLGT